MNNKIETRLANIEVRELTTDTNIQPMFCGYAARFNELSAVMQGELECNDGSPAKKISFQEMIAPDAFAYALDASDIRALINHNEDLILGRTPTTLRVKTDDVGLYIEIDKPNTVVANDAYENVRLGNWREMSFGFIVKRDRWENINSPIAIRTILEIETVTDCSIVTYPAYPTTAIAVRSLDAYQKSEAKLPNNATDEPDDYYKTQLLKLKLSLRDKEEM